MKQTPDAAIEADNAPDLKRGGMSFWLVIFGITAFALVYAVTRAFVWDEGYHLVAAQQISRGKLPYIDFCFPQTPLNAYLNAAIIKLFGQHWRPVHVVATLFSMGSMFLTARFLLTRFPVRRWRLACALCAAVFVGMNEVVIEFGTIGQAYGICLFFSVAAYLVALATPSRRSIVLPLASGVLASIAAGSSLLSVPLLPVILIWIWFYDRAGGRWSKAVAFLVGSAIPFLPIVWLYTKGPEQTIFNIVKYHALYRRADWSGASYHDLQVFASFLDSTQALTLVLLAAGGVLFLVKQCGWERSQRAEFYLAAWICAGEGAYLCTPHPTFGRYFILLTPFITIIAMPGLYALGSKMGYAEKPAWPAGVAGVCMLLMFVAFGIHSFEETTWAEYEKVAKKVAEVTPKGGRIFADELVYFILQSDPPSGMECSYTHVVTLPAAEEKLEHLVSIAELKDQFEQQQFVTVQSCSDAEMDRLGLPATYPNRVDMDDCSVFWSKRPK